MDSKKKKIIRIVAIVGAIVAAIPLGIFIFLRVWAGGGVHVEFEGDRAYLSGLIDDRFPACIESIVEDHPEVTTLVLLEMPGSLNDTANLRASRMARSAGLNTHVTAESVIESGATDFFLAGVQRTAEPGAQIGVHSWAGLGGAVATDFPREHENHEPYLSYYREMGIPEDFYWFTLEAAPADGMHYMSEAELQRFGMLTQ